MKNRQFITLLLIVVVGFVYLWYRVNYIESVVKNIDENVATIDWRIVWDIQHKLNYYYDNN